MIEQQQASFLEALDALALARANARLALFAKWLRSDRRAVMFAELAKVRPVLTLIPGVVLVSRWATVSSLLSQPRNFDVSHNRRSMDDSIGPYMLARDCEHENWHEKAAMQVILPTKDLRTIRQMVREFSSQALQSAIATDASQIELVKTVGRSVPLHIVKQYFGFKDVDDNLLLSWSRATQHDMFRNFAGDPKVHEVNKAACREMLKYIAGRLERLSRITTGSSASREKSTSSGNGVIALDCFSRLQNLRIESVPVLATNRVVANLAGLLVGTIETSSQAIVQATWELLRRFETEPSRKKQILEAARNLDSVEFDSIVQEALRFHPAAPYIARTARSDAILEPGTKFQTTVTAGTLVLVCLGAAMFDEDVFPAPLDFKMDRDPQMYLHFGLGHHQCLGESIGRQIISETIRQTLLLAGIGLHGNGDIDFGSPNGPFPERFFVSCDSAAKNTNKPPSPGLL